MKLKAVVLVVALVFPLMQVHAQNFSTDGPVILSDIHGYDFGPYMQEVTKRLRYNWAALMPEVALKGEKGRVVVTFTITRSGMVRDTRVVSTSGNQTLDRAASGAVSISNPFAALPSDFKGEYVNLQFTFLYNDKSDKKK